MCRNKAEMPMVTADWTLLDAVEATLLNSVVQAIAEREKRKATRGRELAGLAQTHVAAQVDVESGRRRIGAALEDWRGRER